MVKIKISEIFECSKCGIEYNLKSQAEECERSDDRNKKMEQIENAEEFFINKNHLKLLKRFVVSWEDCEFGAPCIDCKRPYGNSNVEDDIIEIIGLKKDKTTIDYDKDEAENYEDIKDYYSDAEYNEKTIEMINKLHKEMMVVLQIIFVTGKIEEGCYIKKDKYDCSSWIKK